MRAYTLKKKNSPRLTAPSCINVYVYVYAENTNIQRSPGSPPLSPIGGIKVGCGSRACIVCKIWVTHSEVAGGGRDSEDILRSMDRAFLGSNFSFLWLPVFLLWVCKFATFLYLIFSAKKFRWGTIAILKQLSIKNKFRFWWQGPNKK